VNKPELWITYEAQLFQSSKTLEKLVDRFYPVLVNFGDDLRLTFPKSKKLWKSWWTSFILFRLITGHAFRLTFPKSKKTLEKLVDGFYSIPVNSGGCL